MEERISITFNEGQGSVVNNHGTKNKMYDIEHLFNNNNYGPIWSSYGIDGSALLLDGNSTVIRVPNNDVPGYQDDLAISVWFAPRAFEWGDPNARENHIADLTGLISHFDYSKSEGFILGYQRFGRLAFSIGTGTNTYTLWADKERLLLHKWNHIGASYNASKGEISLYLNGELIASKILEPGVSIAKPEQELLIGRDGKDEKIGLSYVHSAAGLISDLHVTSNNDEWLKEEVSYKSINIPEIPHKEIALRDILRDDFQRPAFHAQPPQNWMNEPHAAFHYQGKYHLFFQQNPIAPYWRNINWGHWVSDDLVDWKYFSQALRPTENSISPDAIWSGGSAKDINGIPLLFFTAANDNFAKAGLISNQNVGIAYPKDPSDPNLEEWIIADELAISQKAGMGGAGEFRDPHLWYEGDRWNLVIGSASQEGNGGTALVFQTSTLELKDGKIEMDWKYRGPIYQMESSELAYGTTWELPIIRPLENESGLKKHVFIFSPAPPDIADNSIFYMVGKFDVEKGTFTPDVEYDNSPRKFDYGANVFTGPSSFYDESTDKSYVFSIMQGHRNLEDDTFAGWAHSAGLARELKLNADGNDILMSPVSTLIKLYDSEVFSDKSLTVTEINELLTDFASTQFVLDLVIDTDQDNFDEISIKFLFASDEDGSAITYSKQKNEIKGTTLNPGSANSIPEVSGPLEVNGELRIKLIVDRSLIESYFNDERSISMRAYTSSKNSQKLMIEATDKLVIKSAELHTVRAIG